MTIGYFPQMQLAEARIQLQELKKIRESGCCPRERREQQKINELQFLLFLQKIVCRWLNLG
jgi:hypothetical protein